MSRLSRDRESLVDHARVMLLAGFASGVADPASATSAAHSIVFTTDNPNVVTNGAVVIADGDTMSSPESYEAAVELSTALNKFTQDVRAVRTAVAALIGDNIYDVTLAPTTMGANASATRHIGFTFTTDNPALVADGTVVIADGDLTTAAEFLTFCQEASFLLTGAKADVGKVHTPLKRLIDQKGFAGVAAPAALTATAFTVTYTTDAPSISPGASTTFADGDGTISVAEKNDFIAEFKDQYTKGLADLAVARTAFVNYLAVADIA